MDAQTPTIDRSGLWTALVARFEKALVNQARVERTRLASS